MCMCMCVCVCVCVDVDVDVDVVRYAESHREGLTPIVVDGLGQGLGAVQKWARTGYLADAFKGMCGSRHQYAVRMHTRTHACCAHRRQTMIDMREKSHSAC